MDRCIRIAELLLIEKEVMKLEKTSMMFDVSGTVLKKFHKIVDSENKKFNLTPIENLMFVILLRVKDVLEKNQNVIYEIYGQKRIEKYRVDFLITIPSFSDDKVIIECDGHDFHEKTKEQAKHDKERDRFLTSKGYKILRYTGSEIYNDFESTERELIELLQCSTEGKALFRRRKNNEYSC